MKLRTLSVCTCDLYECVSVLVRDGFFGELFCVTTNCLNVCHTEPKYWHSFSWDVNNTIHSTYRRYHDTTNLFILNDFSLCLFLIFLNEMNEIECSPIQILLISEWAVQHFPVNSLCYTLGGFLVSLYLNICVCVVFAHCTEYGIQCCLSHAWLPTSKTIRNLRSTTTTKCQHKYTQTDDLGMWCMTLLTVRTHSCTRNLLLCVFVAFGFFFIIFFRSLNNKTQHKFIIPFDSKQFGSFFDDYIWKRKILYLYL